MTRGDASKNASISIDEREFEVLLATAHVLADVSGAAIKPHFRLRLKVEDKGGEAGYDPVTEGDRAAERAILALLETTHPDHGIIGEEYGSQGLDARYCWIVDPIDGTRAFITGMPTWGTLIGLYDEGKPLLGIMNQPFTGERYWSSRAVAHVRSPDGTTNNLETRKCSDLADAVFSSTHPDLFASPAERKVLSAITSRAKLTRYGGDCYAYCQLAAGNIDLIVEPGLKIYDIAALIPIIERAGGRVTTWEGGSPYRGGDIIACGDPVLHEQVLHLIATNSRSAHQSRSASPGA
jgi:myo-inositol-1(or 4)-monophosphatase